MDANAARSIHHVLGLQSPIPRVHPYARTSFHLESLGPPSASSLHGSFFRTVCGPVIDSSGEVGTTTPFVPSADRLWKRRITCSRTVASRAGSGTRSPSGSDCLTCNRQLGQHPQLHWSGGSPLPRDSI
jgi:hypothetical protein